MPEYLIHRVDDRGRTTGLVSFDCESDEAARSAAVAMASGDTPLELSSGERRVGTVFVNSVVQFRRPVFDPGARRAA